MDWRAAREKVLGLNVLLLRQQCSAVSRRRAEQGRAQRGREGGDEQAVTIDLDNSAFSVVLWGKIILEKNDRCPLDAARSPGMGATIVPKVQKRSSLIAVVSTEGHFSGLNNHFEILGRHANSRVQTGS
ncbi:hypothetical protein AXG93_4689s1020 [Marchantia polymorpha subsp. ruderalis]|uniref:Uncharacterized protein n=1 Tax=Marchantia polymorpha subsp. ruderalis TaxID=1480154 RepID=A0A176WKD4_MARPO|nr:hypothetical protein AXG93_4689s1020 [Marchantia polymorpha subsp. ruderalis]